MLTLLVLMVSLLLLFLIFLLLVLRGRARGETDKNFDIANLLGELDLVVALRLEDLEALLVDEVLSCFVGGIISLFVLEFLFDDFLQFDLG